MREKQIDERLKAICEMVPKDTKCLLDVGTDHGYVPIYLIKKHLIKTAIAADISISSLQKAKDEIERNGFKNKIQTRQGNGLQVIYASDKVDTIVIAGMGGVLISEILEAARELIETQAFTFILQPVQAPEELRNYLCRHGYVIQDERFLKWANKYYQVFSCRFQKTSMENNVPDICNHKADFAQKEEKVPYYYELSGKLIENPNDILLEYVNLQCNILKKIEQKLLNQKKENGLNEMQQERLSFVVAKKTFYERVKKNASR